MSLLNGRIQITRMPEVVVYLDTWHHRTVAVALREPTFGYAVLLKPKYYVEDGISYRQSISDVDDLVESIMRGKQ